MLARLLPGYSPFLGLIIDRLHHYIRELRTTKKDMEAVKKQSRTLEEAKLGSAEEIQGYQKEIASLKEQVQELQNQSQMKTGQLKTAQASYVSLQKQSEGLLAEYDRLTAENKEFRDQLQSIDRHMSHSDGKKNSWSKFCNFESIMFCISSATRSNVLGFCVLPCQYHNRLCNWVDGCVYVWADHLCFMGADCLMDWEAWIHNRQLAVVYWPDTSCFIWPCSVGGDCGQPPWVTLAW